MPLTVAVKKISLGGVDRRRLSSAATMPEWKHAADHAGFSCCKFGLRGYPKDGRWTEQNKQ
jgi:hypothetical protein